LDPEPDFFLFVVQLLECDDFAAERRKIGRLRGAFASEIYFTFLEEAPLLTQRHPRSLALNFQGDLAKACADKTHGVMLSHLVWQQIQKVLAAPKSIHARIINGMRHCS